MKTVSTKLWQIVRREDVSLPDCEVFYATEKYDADDLRFQIDRARRIMKTSVAAREVESVYKPLALVSMSQLEDDFKAVGLIAQKTPKRKAARFPGKRKVRL